jgi:hypothetical protein
VTTETDTLAPPVGDLAAALIAKFRSGVDPMAWMGNAARARGCSHPVRLRGSSTTVNSATGEIVGRFESADLPDSVLYLPCGTRRGAMCPACAEVYRQDTYQLLKAGLAGGKGVPDEVTSHPAVFATLTAPTFGPVHTRRTTRDGRVLPCRPRRDKPVCGHGNPMFCTRLHAEDEKTLGAPLCLDCYDHDGQVVWNLHAPELWRRTVNTLIRSLDAMIGKHAPVKVRLSYAKVAEYQARGVIHFHLTEFYRDESQRLAPASVRRLHAALRRALNVAMRWQLIAVNPAALVEPSPHIEVRPYNVDEARRFLDAAREDWLE